MPKPSMNGGQFDVTSQSSDTATNWTAEIEPARTQGEALNELVAASLSRLFTHASYKWSGVLKDDAPDVVNEFALKMLQGGVVSRADRNIGRFRTYLLRCFDNHVIDWLRKKMRRSEAMLAGPDDEPALATSFDFIWAEELFRNAAEALLAKCQKSRSMDIWRVAEDQFIGPVLRGSAPLTYEQLRDRHQFDSCNVVSGKVRTARKWLEQCVRSLVGEYAQDEDELEMELSNMISALANRWSGPQKTEAGMACLHTHLHCDLETYDNASWIRLSPMADNAKTGIVSFYDLIHHPAPPRPLLEFAKSFAKDNTDNPVSDLPDEAARVLYYLCIAAGLRSDGDRIANLTDDQLTQGFSWCRRRKWIDEATRDLLDAAMTIHAG